MEASAPHFSWGGRDCPHSMYCAYIYIYIYVYIYIPQLIYTYIIIIIVIIIYIYILMVRIDPHWHPMVDCWINDPIDYPMFQCIPLYMYSKYCRPTSKIPFVIHPNSLIVSTPLYTNIIKYQAISCTAKLQGPQHFWHEASAHCDIGSQHHSRPCGLCVPAGTVRHC